MYDGLRVLVLGACNLNDTVYSLGVGESPMRSCSAIKLSADAHCFALMTALPQLLHLIAEIAVWHTSS
jgi:hypothetical protein